MGKIKIHEIAKKLGLNSKEVLEKAIELGLEVKTHMSGISEEDAKKLISEGFIINNLNISSKQRKELEGIINE